MNTSPQTKPAIGDTYRLKEHHRSLWKVEQVVERGVVLISAIYSNPHRHLCEWDKLDLCMEKVG